MLKRTNLKIWRLPLNSAWKILYVWSIADPIIFWLLSIVIKQLLVVLKNETRKLRKYQNVNKKKTRTHESRTSRNSKWRFSCRFLINILLCSSKRWAAKTQTFLKNRTLYFHVKLLSLLRRKRTWRSNYYHHVSIVNHSLKTFSSLMYILFTVQISTFDIHYHFRNVHYVLRK